MVKLIGRPPKQDYSSVGIRKIERVMLLAKLLSHGRYTIQRLSEICEVGDRTIYRYLVLFESMGMVVESDLYSQYFITNNTCPICGHKHKEN